MTTDFTRLIFIWLTAQLTPLTASLNMTSGMNHNFTDVMNNQLSTQEASTSSPPTDVSGLQPSIANTVEKETVKAGTTPSLQTTPPTTFSQNNQTPTNSTSSQVNGSTFDTKSTTEEQHEAATSAPMVATSPASNPITTVPSMLMSSTQSQSTGKTSQLISDETTHPATHPTIFRSTSNSSSRHNKPTENKTAGTGPVTVQSTGFYKPSPTTKKTATINSTTPNGRQVPPKKKTKNGTNHGKIVAGIIGGALVVMMVGFLVIYMKKRKLKRLQIKTNDWAGPSPFIEGGTDNGQANLRSSNQVSLSSFLPQRLSKRLSLLPEANEELEDQTVGMTFIDNYQETAFTEDVAKKDVQDGNGTAVAVPEVKSTGDAPETV